MLASFCMIQNNVNGSERDLHDAQACPFRALIQYAQNKTPCDAMLIIIRRSITQEKSMFRA